jgi:hypothetical protein
MRGILITMLYILYQMAAVGILALAGVWPFAVWMGGLELPWWGHVLFVMLVLFTMASIRPVILWFGKNGLLNDGTDSEGR